MINVLVFEPDVEKARTLYTAVVTAYKLKSFEASVQYAKDKADALKRLSKDGAKYDIAFVGIDSDADARAVAAAFRKGDIKSSLVYHGGSAENLCRLLQYRPSAYLERVNDMNKIAGVAIAMYNEQYHGTRCFTIKLRGEIIRIPFSEIEFFESQNRKVVIHRTGKEPIEFTSTLDQIMTVVKYLNCFVRCHQSYLANLDNIRLIDMRNSVFVSKTDKPVYISKRRLTEVKDFIERYNRSNREIEGRI